MTTRAATGRRSRAKGHAYERHVCQLLTAHLPRTTWRRRIQPRGARVDGSDVQGVAEAPAGCHPIALVHRPGTRYESDRACLRLGDLLELAGLDTIGEPEDSLEVELAVGSLLCLLAGWWGRP